MTQDVRPRRTSLVFPILLIIIGILFLYSRFRPDFDPWPILWTYWPVLLILLGLAAIWDFKRPRDPGVAVSRSGSVVGIVIIVLLIAFFAGHGRTSAWHRHSNRAMQHHAETVERQNAKQVHTSIDMNAGDLTVSSGAGHLLDANFDYRDTEAPRVQYRVDNGDGDLSIDQDNSDSNYHTTSDNSWNIRLAGDVPMDLKVNMGAGQGNLHLRDINLTNLELNIGAGQVDIDLTGDRKKDL
ncbi:MAG TPA: toast rack family protein, partial [Candidatus Acidoferrum sp.]